MFDHFFKIFRPPIAIVIGLAITSSNLNANVYELVPSKDAPATAFTPEMFQEFLTHELSGPLMKHLLDNPDDIVTNPEALLVYDYIPRFVEWLKSKNYSVVMNAPSTPEELAGLFEIYFAEAITSEPLLIAQRELIESLAQRSEGGINKELKVAERNCIRVTQIRYLAMTMAGMKDPKSIQFWIGEIPLSEYSINAFEHLEIMEIPIVVDGRVPDLWRDWFLFEHDDVSRFRQLRPQNELLRITSTIKQLWDWEVIPDQSEKGLARRIKKYAKRGVTVGPRKRHTTPKSEVEMLEFLMKAIDYNKIPKVKQRTKTGEQTLITPEQIRGIIDFMLHKPTANLDSILSAATSERWSGGKPIKRLSKQTVTHLQTQMKFWLKLMYLSYDQFKCVQQVAHLAPR